MHLIIQDIMQFTLSSDNHLNYPCVVVFKFQYCSISFLLLNTIYCMYDELQILCCLMWLKCKHPTNIRTIFFSSLKKQNLLLRVYFLNYVIKLIAAGERAAIIGNYSPKKTHVNMPFSRCMLHWCNMSQKDLKGHKCNYSANEA